MSEPTEQEKKDQDALWLAVIFDEKEININESVVRGLIQRMSASSFKTDKKIKELRKRLSDEIRQWRSLRALVKQFRARNEEFERRIKALEALPPSLSKE